MSLHGKVIAITRPEKQADELAKLISKLGGKPYVVPTVEIKPQRNKRLITQLFNRILDEQIGSLIFMSVNGVASFIEYLEEPELKAKFLEKLDKTRIIAVGPKTRMELEKHGIKVNLVPQRYSSEGILESFKKMDLREGTVAILRSNKSSGHLMRELEKLGAKVLEVPIYECTPPTDRSKVLVFINDLLKGKIDVVTFTSSSAALNLFKIASEHITADDLRKCLRKTIITTIGPVTQRTLEDLGVKADVVPREYTVEAMMDSLVHYIRQSATPGEQNEESNEVFRKTR